MIDERVYYTNFHTPLVGEIPIEQRKFFKGKYPINVHTNKEQALHHRGKGITYKIYAHRNAIFNPDPCGTMGFLSGSIIKLEKVWGS